MKVYTLITLALILSMGLFAQSVDLSVISSAGGQFETETESLTFVVGEIAVETFSSDNLMLTQGFLQPFSSTIGVPENETNSFDVNIYPNPASNYFLIDFDIEGQYTMDILDINGKKIETKEVNNKSNKINFSNYHSGTYFVRLFNNADNTFNTYVIVKQGF